MDERPDILGADKVFATFGQWPSFHDGEIVRLHLERDGVSTISIQLVGPDGRCASGRVLTFTMEQITDLSLDGEDINRQNVISCLLVEKTDCGTRLTFGPCYGLSGRITAERVRVEVDAN
jgi:Immunity protein 50